MGRISNDIVHAVIAGCHEARHRRQMPAGRVSPQPNAVSIDRKTEWIGTQPSEGGSDVLQLCREQCLPAVPDGDGYGQEACLGERGIRERRHCR